MTRLNALLVPLVWTRKAPPEDWASCDGSSVCSVSLLLGDPVVFARSAAGPGPGERVLTRSQSGRLRLVPPPGHHSERDHRQRRQEPWPSRTVGDSEGPGDSAR